LFSHGFGGFADFSHPAFKGFLDRLCVWDPQGVLGSDGVARPVRGLLGRGDGGELCQEPVSQFARLAGIKVDDGWCRPIPRPSAACAAVFGACGM
jgi:hypothetical protein